MKMFSVEIEDLHSHYVDNLKKALDMGRVATKPIQSDEAVDGELADEFKKHLEQTEGYLERLEGLLHSSTRKAA